MNNINWKDAFNDEEFRNELDSYIRKYIEDYPKLDLISEEDFNILLSAKHESHSELAL